MAERKITRADGTPVTPSSEKKTTDAESKPAAKKTAAKKTAAKKPAAKKVEKADGTTVEAKPAKETGNPKVFRIAAIALWVVAIVFEVLAVLVLFGKIAITAIPTLALIIIFLVLDLACVSVGSTFWKKANHIDPASEANKVKFWLWNNLGLIVTAFAFIPFVILSLTNKNADKKTKTIAAIVAAIALLIGGLVSYDWNPVSQEGKDSAIETLGDQKVYWTAFGTVYHTHNGNDENSCGHLNNSDNIEDGTVEEAINSGKTRLCKDCAKKDNIQIDENGALTQKSIGNVNDADSKEEKDKEEKTDAEVNEGFEADYEGEDNFELAFAE